MLRQRRLLLQCSSCVWFAVALSSIVSTTLAEEDVQTFQIPQVPSASTTTTPTILPTTSFSPTLGPTATLQPSITPLPSISAFPSTETFSPTNSFPPTDNAICNICGAWGDNGAVTTNEAMLVFPDGTSVECGVAFESGQTGQISEDNCRFIQDFIAATVTVANETSTIATNVCGCTGGASTCSICPPGTAISFPDGIFPLPDSIANNTASNNNEVGEDSFQCSFAQTVANTDIWTPDTCLELQLAADVNGTNPCGCQHTDESGNATTTDDVAPDNDDGTLVLDTCSICGGNSNNEEDLQVTNIDTIVPLPPLFLESLPPSLLNATDNFTCGSLEEMGQDFALWSPEVCAFLQMKSADVCECQAKPTSSNNTTPGGVAPPSPSAVDQGPESRASSVWTLSSFGSTTALAAMGAITFWMATWW